MPVTSGGKIKLHESYRTFTTIPGTWLVSINTIFLLFPTLARVGLNPPRGQGEGEYWRMAGAIKCAPRASFSVVLPADSEFRSSAL